MADIRAPDIKQKVKEAYETGKYTFKNLEEEFGIPQGTIKSWSKRDKDSGQPWVKSKSKKVATKQKTKSKKVATEKNKKRYNESVEEKLNNIEIENAEFTERQRLFCLYYIKSFNATMAAIKAGYAKESAHVEGHRLLRNAKVAAEIRRLKGTMTQDIFIDAMDVLNKYIKIAFADITDFVEFGNREIVERDDEGKPLKDENGDIVTYKINYVNFNNSDMIDGTIIKEVKQGKDGISVKLEDRMKALEKLELYFDLLPDKFKRKIEEEKLKISKEKLEIARSKAQTTSEKENEVADMLRGIINDLN